MAVERVSTTTKAGAAFLAIRDAIHSGTLRPGEQVTLQTLAEELGMSLTPVREALHQLSAQGLVERRSNQRTFVTQYTHARAEEVYRLRLVLEPLATQLAAERMDKDDLAGLESVLAELDSCIAAGRDAEIPALNARLHRGIYQAARSPFLLEFIDRLWNGVPFQAVSLTRRKKQSAEQHHAIIGALRRGEGEEAARATYEHIASAAQETLQHIRELHQVGSTGDDSDSR